MSTSASSTRKSQSPGTVALVSTRTLLIAGLLVSLVLAGVVSFYASGNPDGLEFVAEKTGFLDSAGEHVSANGPLADYSTRGIDNARLSGGLAGILGVLSVLVIAGLLFRFLGRDTKTDA